MKLFTLHGTIPEDLIVFVIGGALFAGHLVAALHFAFEPTSRYTFWAPLVIVALTPGMFVSLALATRNITSISIY